MSNKVTGLQYCFEKALEVIRETYPDAAEDCFTGDYETAYWNDAEAYVDRKGSWEYPGTWYPSPVAYTDEKMIERLIEEGSSNLEKRQKEE